MKYDVRDTAAAKSVSAYVILKGSRQVATVRSHYSDGGRVIVNVWQQGEAAARSAAAAEKAGEPMKKTDRYDSPGEYQAAAAGGGGYDKFAAALAGMYIDGHVMGNHSSPKGAPKLPAGRKTYPEGFKVPKGYHLANWQNGSDEHTAAAAALVAELEKGGNAWDSEAVQSAKARLIELQRESGGYMSCYRSAGLRFLEETGYTVIQAL